MDAGQLQQTLADCPRFRQHIADRRLKIFRGSDGLYRFAFVTDAVSEAGRASDEMAMRCFKRVNKN